jgi:opacity protein-like surface antigen
MKILSLPTLIISSLLVSVSGASAQVYLQGFAQWLDTDYDNSTGIGGRIGYAFDDMNAIELEFSQTDLNSINTTYTYQGDDVAVQGKADLSIILINYRFTYPLTERFRILAGAGLGGTVAQVDLTTRFGNDDGTSGVFTFQGFAGVEFFILPQLSVHGAYRLMIFDDFTYKSDEVEVNIDAGNAQIIEAGVTFYF